MGSISKEIACRFETLHCIGILLLGIIDKSVWERKMWGTLSSESLDPAQVEIPAVSRSSLALVRQHTILQKDQNVQLNHTPKLSLKKCNCCWHGANSKPMKVHQR